MCEQWGMVLAVLSGKYLLAPVACAAQGSEPCSGKNEMRPISV